MEANVIHTTTPTLKNPEPIPGVLAMGSFTAKEHGVEVVHSKQMKSSFACTYGAPQMGGVVASKIPMTKF